MRLHPVPVRSTGLSRRLFAPVVARRSAIVIVTASPIRPRWIVSAFTLISINPISICSTRVSNCKDLDVSLFRVKYADVGKSGHATILKVEMDFCESVRIRFNILQEE